MDTQDKPRWTSNVHRFEACAGNGSGASRKRSTRSERILVIDPSGELHGSFANTLTGAGHHVVPASRAILARAVHVSDPVDLVIVHFDRLRRSDWKPLSVMHGRSPELPILAVFSESKPGGVLLAVAMALGVRRILPLPLDPGKLLDIVDDLAGS